MTSTPSGTSAMGDFGKSGIQPLIETPKAAMARKKGQLGLFHKDKNITFPSDLSTHFMCFQIYRYMHNNVGEAVTTPYRNIFLPVPTNLVESINVTRKNS